MPVMCSQLLSDIEELKKSKRDVLNESEVS